MGKEAKQTQNQNPSSPAIREGILLLDKPRGKTSFYLVALLRRLLEVKKIGHAGTLDPFATGVMVLLVGRNYTRLADRYSSQDKEYEATITLGIETDTFDCDGKVINESKIVPSHKDIEQVLEQFQGDVLQVPPMFSAKKVNGQKLCNLARKGQVIERAPVAVRLKTILLDYTYPYLKLHVSCSKGTYIRTIAQDIGKLLECGAHVSSLTRTKSGKFHLNDCLKVESLPSLDLHNQLIR